MIWRHMRFALSIAPLNDFSIEFCSMVYFKTNRGEIHIHSWIFINTSIKSMIVLVELLADHLVAKFIELLIIPDI